MKFQDIGVIIDCKKHSESSAIVKVFSKDHGIYKGYVRGAFSKKNRAIFQVGNLISFEWSSRIEDSLGSFFYCDIVKSYSGKIIFDRLRLSCFLSLISIIDKNFHERDVLCETYDRLVKFLDSLVDHDISDKNIVIDYIIFEFEILSQLGYGMDLTRCAVSQKEDDLAYVSPKSGRAVSKEAGEPYSQRILELPQFIYIYSNGLLDEMNIAKQSVTAQDIKNGFKLTGFFLEKHIFAQNSQCNKHRSDAAKNINAILQL